MENFIDFVIPDDAHGGWNDLINEEKIENEDQIVKNQSYKDHWSDSMEDILSVPNVKINDLKNVDVPIFDFDVIEPPMRGADFLFHKR